jgi:hypothetical protein
MDDVVFDAPEPRQSGRDHEYRNHGADTPLASHFEQLVEESTASMHSVVGWSANDQFSRQPEIP